MANGSILAREVALISPISRLGRAGQKWLGTIPLFDPRDGWTVAEPPGHGPGYWAGAPSALYDQQRRRFLLSYRVRRPLAEGRGYETRVAQSDDGRKFVDIWARAKEEFDSASIERSALVRTPQGKWRLYVSYVALSDNRWEICMLEADSPDQFVPARRQIVLRPDDVDSEGVKDPYVLLIGGMYYMYVPYGPKASVVPGSSRADLHGTGNVFTTGLVSHPTGLATCPDGIHFQWHGDVLTPGKGWDRNMARLSCVVYIPPAFVVFYDGRTSVGDVYEDRTGLATGLLPNRFQRLTHDGPVLGSPHGTGCLRYLDVVPMPDSLYFFYESARLDGAHELRGSVVKPEMAPASN